MLGGAFLVKSAIDAGFFGPVARIAAAILAGAAMIYAGDRLRRHAAARREDGGLAPPVLAGAGGATLYAAIYAAYGLYELIPSVLTIILLATASAGMVVLAVIHRVPAVAAVGLAGAFAAPALAARGEPQPAALFLFVLGVAAGGLFAARLMKWRSISFVAIAGGALWQLLWLIAGDSENGAFAFAAYLPALFALNAAIAGNEAKADLTLSKMDSSFLTDPDHTLSVFHVALLAIAALGALLVLKLGLSAYTALAFMGLSIASIAAARWRPGLILAPPAFALALLVAIAMAGGRAIEPLLIALFASLFTAGGFVLMRKNAPLTVPAAMIAFSPILFLSALFIAGAATHPAPYWGAIAMVFAIANLALLQALDKAGGVNAAPGAASAYALGASLSAMIAAAMAADGAIWPSDSPCRRQCSPSCGAVSG